MDTYSSTSDVKSKRERGTGSQINAGFASDVLPEAPVASKAGSSEAGVSTHSVPIRKEKEQWYALRTTYGREKRAYDYFVSRSVPAFYPTVRRVREVGGKRVAVEESRIPNIFFAYGTEEAMKRLVYDNVNLPYLRFYYRKRRVGGRVIGEPLVVPERQMESLRIICAAEAADIIVTTGELRRFAEGDPVRITGGSFAGIEGRVGRFHGQQRVAVVIEGLLTAATAYVPSAFLERIKE